MQQWHPFLFPSPGGNASSPSDGLQQQLPPATAVYVLSVAGPTVVALSTCSPATSFSAHLELYEHFSSEANRSSEGAWPRLLGRSWAHPKMTKGASGAARTDSVCGMLTHRFTRAADAWLVVGSAHAHLTRRHAAATLQADTADNSSSTFIGSGSFEVNLQCRPTASGQAGDRRKQSKYNSQPTQQPAAHSWGEEFVGSSGVRRRRLFGSSASSGATFSTTVDGNGTCGLNQTLQVVGCGEAVNGSTVGLNDVYGGLAGDAVFALPSVGVNRSSAHLGPTTVTVTACAACGTGSLVPNAGFLALDSHDDYSHLEAWAPRLWLLDAHPASGVASVLAEGEAFALRRPFSASGASTSSSSSSSNATHLCASLAYNMTFKSGVRFAVVEAADGIREGAFRFKMACAPPQPLPCQGRFLTCGDEPRTGVLLPGEQTTFVVSAWQPHSAALSTCSAPNLPSALTSSGSFDSSAMRRGALTLTLWDGPPDQSDSSVIGRSEPAYPCGYLAHFFDRPGTAWLVVQRNTPSFDSSTGYSADSETSFGSGQQGYGFSVSITCLDTANAPAMSNLTCGGLPTLASTRAAPLLPAYGNASLVFDYLQHKRSGKNTVGHLASFGANSTASLYHAFRPGSLVFAVDVPSGSGPQRLSLDVCSPRTTLAREPTLWLFGMWPPPKDPRAAPPGRGLLAVTGSAASAFANEAHAAPGFSGRSSNGLLCEGGSLVVEVDHSGVYYAVVEPALADSAVASGNLSPFPFDRAAAAHGWHAFGFDGVAYNMSQPHHDSSSSSFLNGSSSFQTSFNGSRAVPSWDLVELSVACESLPVSAFEDTCASPYVACGDSELGTNVGYPSFVGGSSGDALFLFTAWTPTTLALSTCSPRTNFATRLLVFDGRPSGGELLEGEGGATAALNVTLLANSDAWDNTFDGLKYGSPTACSTLSVDLKSAGTYFIVVEGRDDDEDGDGSSTWPLHQLPSEGLFELIVGCRSLPATAPEDTCAYQYLSCGSSARGTTVGHPDYVGRGSGAALYMVTAWQLSRLAVTTCGPNGGDDGSLRYTNFKAHLSLWDGPPDPTVDTGSEALHWREKGGRLVAESLSHEPCATLFADLTSTGTYYLAVSGWGYNDEGAYEAALACEPLPHGNNNDDGDGACAYDYLSCGETTAGITRGFPTFVSDSALSLQAPDRYYLVTLWHPTLLTASTCNPRTAGFPLTLSLYDAAPNEPNTTLIATQEPNTPDGGCGLLFYRALKPMTVYLTLDGLHPDAANDDDDAYDDSDWIGDQDGSGFFELSLACEDLSGPDLSDRCGYDYLECGDVKMDTTVGRPDFVGHDGRGDGLHVFTIWAPTQITLSTCAEGTGFPAQVLVFAGDPRGFDPAATESADGDSNDDYDQGGGRRDDDEASTAGASQWGRGVRLLAATDPSEARREGCGSATVALSDPGSYFAVVTSAAFERFTDQVSHEYMRGFLFLVSYF